MPIGEGTTPFFSPNPQSGYPVPPEQWSRLHYNIPLQPSSQGNDSRYCALPKVDGKQMSDKYDDLFKAAGAKYHIDWRLIKALAATESGPNFDRLSNGAARGVMQINTAVHKEFTPDTFLTDTATNIDFGTSILRDNFNRSHNPETALANYKGYKTFDALNANEPDTFSHFLGYLQSEGVNI